MQWLFRLLRPQRSYSPSPLIRGVTFTRPVRIKRVDGLVIEDSTFTRRGSTPALTIEGPFDGR